MKTQFVGLLLFTLAAACADNAGETSRETLADHSVGQATLRVVAQDGQDTLAPDADGLLHAEVRISHIENVRAVGFELQAVGAEIVHWQRVDTVLTKSGGQILQATGRADGDKLTLVVATTESVDVGGEALLATLTLRPIVAAGELMLSTDGSDLGVVTATAGRANLEVTSATFIR